jgi:putative transposase
MPRANRHFLTGYVWHITHRRHKKDYLLKFTRGRQSYLRWLFEAKNRFAVSVLNYIVTCNHFLCGVPHNTDLVNPDRGFQLIQKDRAVPVIGQ